MNLNQKEIKLTKADGRDMLIIPSSSNLETILKNPHTPSCLKDILKMLFWQFRNEITVERTLMSPNLAPAWNAALLAWGAEVVFPNHEKTSSVADYLHRTGFHPEKFYQLNIPVGISGKIWGSNHVSRTPSDKPIVFVAAVLDIQDSIIKDARIALTGVWHEHVRLSESANEMTGKKLSKDLILEISEKVKFEVTPSGDFLGSAQYRKEMARVLTMRTLMTCFAGGVK